VKQINPNFITTLRIAIFAPVACIALMYGHLWLALTCMALGELTDFFDGYIARRTGQVSDFGKIYDPMCDSIFHMVIWISLLHLGWVSPYFVILFFVRDAIVANIRILLIKRGIVLGARWSGKVKAAAQAGAQIALVVLHLFVTGTALLSLQFAAVFAAAAVTLYSLYDYARDSYQKVGVKKVAV